MVSIIDYKELTPKEFVLLCADVLEAETFENIRVLEGPGDWKEDIHAEERVHSQSGVSETLKFKVQCKHYAKSGNTLSPSEVNELFPYLHITDATRLLIITDTDLTTQAKQEIDSYNTRFPINKVIYWTQRELDNRLLKHRWIINKHFPVAKVNKSPKQSNFNPYKLLESYKEADTDYFFGRENDINVLAESIYRNRIVILFGESGVGKTSLLNAGLFPRLRKEDWLIISTRCLDTPIENVQRETIAQIERLDTRINLDCLKQNVSFDVFIHNLTGIMDRLSLRTLIVIDQAEELFTLCDEDDRNALSSGITTSLTSTMTTGSLSFLFSLRDDYIGDLRSWTRAKKSLDAVFSWDGLHSVGRFTVEEARMAIEEPTKMSNFSYDKHLLEQLLNDLSELGCGFVYQPYLQIVCSTLFTESSTGMTSTDNVLIKEDVYKKLNGATEIIGSFFSDKLWIGFTKNEQTIARKVTQALTTSEGLRHQLSLDDLELATSGERTQIDTVLQRLIDKRLVHRLVMENNQQPVFELIHDFLGKQIASQLSEEEKSVKEAEELLTDSLKRWNKHGAPLNNRELSILEKHRKNLKFTHEGMTLIFSSIIDWSSLPSYEIWFDYFGEKGINAFLEVFLTKKRTTVHNFDKIVQNWDNKTIDTLIETILKKFTPASNETKLVSCLELLSATKDVRVLSNSRILDTAKNIILSRSDRQVVAKALSILISSQRGLEILKLLRDKTVEILINTIQTGYPLGGYYWYYNPEKREIFVELVSLNPELAAELLQNKIWNSFNARETEIHVYMLSLISQDVHIFRKILLEHWTAYAREAAAKALTEIGTKDALDSLIDGLSTPYSIVLRQILIALGRKGDERALPVLEKLLDDPLITESNLGYIHRTIQRIKKRKKI